MPFNTSFFCFVGIVHVLWYAKQGNTYSVCTLGVFKITQLLKFVGARGYKVLLLMASSVILFLYIWVKPKAGTNTPKFWFYHRGSKNSFQFRSIFWSAELAKVRGFQIWSQNWNRMIFDPLFGHKAIENCPNPVFWQFSTVLWPRSGSNVIWF